MAAVEVAAGVLVVVEVVVAAVVAAFVVGVVVAAEAVGAAVVEVAGEVAPPSTDDEKESEATRPVARSITVTFARAHDGLDVEEEEVVVRLSWHVNKPACTIFTLLHGATRLLLLLTMMLLVNTTLTSTPQLVPSLSRTAAVEATSALFLLLPYTKTREVGTTRGNPTSETKYAGGTYLYMRIAPKETSTLSETAVVMEGG